MAAKKRKVRTVAKATPKTPEELMVAQLLEAKDGLYRIALAQPCIVEMRLEGRTVDLKFHTADAVAALEVSN